MTERIVLTVRQRLPYRTAVLAALLSALVGVAVSAGVQAQRHASSPSPASSHRVSGPALQSLTPAARASISAALGADDPAYHFNSSRGGFQAVNRAQHLRVAADASGVQLRSRALQLSLSLRADGYGSALHALDAVKPTSHANRVAYARSGINEWYVNGPLGLEQGFTVERAPAAGASGPLTLALAVSGDVRASLAASAQSVTFRGARGGSVKYGRLSVSDASGRALHSWLTLEHGNLMLRVDARGARWPLRVDPFVEEGPASELPLPEEGGEEREHAGVSVALSSDGNTALVGAPDGLHSSGAVWVFEHSPGREWKQEAKLEMPESESEPASCPEEGVSGEEAEECRFGWTVALSADGQTALVGAPAVNFEASEPSGETIGQAGAAWIFTHTGSVWLPTKLSSPEPEPSGHFGRSVALSSDGETALVGAPGEESGHGRAWLFTGSGSGWSAQDAPLEALSEKGPAHLGRSVALSGDGETALVGGPADDALAGAAWLFQDSDGGWQQVGPKLTGAGESAGSHFADSVALSQDGGTALIGAPDNANGKGAAWVFAQSGSEWSEQGSKLTGVGGGDEQFGESVALSADGSTAIIGAPQFQTAKSPGGAAWIYERSGASWGGPVRRLEDAGARSTTARFGVSVAISADGETQLVGAPLDLARRGAAWIFRPGPSVWEVTPPRGAEAGETAVKIYGEHLLGATAVRFGEHDATITKDEERRIEAITPPGTGLVKVTVETPIGISELSTGAEFMYEPLGEGSGKKEKEPEPPPETGTGSSGGGSSGGGSSSGGSHERPHTPQGSVSVLAIGPAAGGACAATLLSKRIAVAAHNIALLKLEGTGAGSCSGKLRLRVKIRLSRKRFELKTIGTAVFSIASGKRLSVSVKLNAAGRALLRTGHGRLDASLLIVRSTPAPLLASTASVRLTRLPAAKPKR